MRIYDVEVTRRPLVDDPRPRPRQATNFSAPAPYAAVVARVDPDDDSIHRWVVWHYRYDSYRSERRNVVVAAFDNPGEFFADIAERSSQLRRRRERGEDVHPAEQISGAMYEPGYRRVQRNAHLLKRAIEHGVVPTRVAELDLPANTATMRAERRSNGARLNFGERRDGHSGDQATRTPR
jgi:hypothetical protein